MTEASRHDAWQAGDSYDSYMGRWSRGIAPRFLDWLDASGGLDWCEVGCGTGALTAAILSQCQPRSVVAIDPSEGFLAKARANVPDARATFELGDAQALMLGTASRNVAVSALVLNFVPDRDKALSEMKRVVHPGGGVEFMRAFWNAATALDPKARDLTEDRRFPFCTREGLVDLARRAGLASIDSTAIEVPTVFANFDDYWRPFTLGAGPAPGYCTTLEPDARERLRKKLHDSLPRAGDGSIPLATRAWAVKATVA